MSTAGNEHAVTFVDPAAALAASAAAARRANAVPPLATPPAAHGGPIPVVYGAFLLPEEGNARGHHATHAPPPPPLRRWDRPNWDQNPFEAFEARRRVHPRHRRRRRRRSGHCRSSNRYERGQEPRGGNHLPDQPVAAPQRLGSGDAQQRWSSQMMGMAGADGISGAAAAMESRMSCAVTSKDDAIS